MTKVIGDYTAANSIDGSTNYLLIQPGNSSTAYKKINRNVFLGVTAQPVDISSTQTLSGKTLDNSNTVTLKDTLFTLQDDSDTTKQARFQLSGITTATTRTYTLPNASSTLVDLSTSQTLTNKTLTSPTITGGSIDNTTITVDSVAGHTSSTSGTIYGMSVSAGKVGSNGVVTASITDSAVTPAKLLTGTGSTWTWQSWTPTWTNLTVGNGTVQLNVYTQVGKVVFFKVEVIFGTTTSVSGVITISLPVSGFNNVAIVPFGMVTCADNSAGNAEYTGILEFASSTTARVKVLNASSTYTTLDVTSSTVPFTWATNDQLYITGTYQAA